VPKGYQVIHGKEVFAVKMTKEKFSPVKEEQKLDESFEREISDCSYVSESYDDQNVENFCQAPRSRSSSRGRREL
jgi:hypothetical protein